VDPTSAAVAAAAAAAVRGRSLRYASAIVRQPHRSKRGSGRWGYRSWGRHAGTAWALHGGGEQVQVGVHRGAQRGVRHLGHQLEQRLWTRRGGEGEEGAGEAMSAGATWLPPLWSGSSWSPETQTRGGGFTWLSFSRMSRARSQ
jgi:hypothetical protein